jgi:hypothetical protein
VSAPDYISPIVAYRLWQWDDAGLKSLNGVRWIPRQPLLARCRAFHPRRIIGRATHPAQDAPQADCRCGVYGAKRLDSLQSMCFWDSGVRGEVFLWGTVVEHEHGWRAQFAYPKCLHLPPDTLPVTFAEMESRLQSLVPYRCDIFITHDGGSIPLWRKDSGLDAAGIDFLMSRGKDWYARRKRTLKRGDCVALRGRGIAAVEHVDEKRVIAVLGKRKWVRLMRRDITWNDTYSRWEASVSA